MPLVWPAVISVGQAHALIIVLTEHSDNPTTAVGTDGYLRFTGSSK